MLELQSKNPDSLIAGLPYQKCNIYLSVDKITILGSFKNIATFLPDWEAKHLDVINRRSGGKLYRYSFSILNNNYHVDACPFNKTHDIRIEFNPNNVEYQQSLISLIKNLSWSKISRIDIAVDYIDNYNFSEFYVESLTKKLATYKLANTRHLSGYVFGTRNSDMEYRVYDKKLQLRTEKKIDAKCESWWRIEAEITPKNGKSWFEYRPFEDMTIGQPVYDGSTLSFKDTAILYALYNDSSGLDTLSIRERRKFKKLMQSEVNLRSISIDHHPFYLCKHARIWLDEQISILTNTYTIGENDENATTNS